MAKSENDDKDKTLQTPLGLDISQCKLETTFEVSYKSANSEECKYSDDQVVAQAFKEDIIGSGNASAELQLLVLLVNSNGDKYIVQKDKLSTTHTEINKHDINRILDNIIKELTPAQVGLLQKYASNK